MCLFLTHTVMSRAVPSVSSTPLKGKNSIVAYLGLQQHSNALATQMLQQPNAMAAQCFSNLMLFDCWTWQQQHVSVSSTSLLVAPQKQSKIEQQTGLLLATLRYIWQLGENRTIELNTAGSPHFFAKGNPYFSTSSFHDLNRAN